MTALRMASPEAWRQRHHAGYVITEQDLVDRSICPCCGRLLSRQWFQQIFGCEPEDFRQGIESPLRDVTDEPTGWADPSDDPVYDHEQRSTR